MPQTQGGGTVYVGGPGSGFRLPLYGKFGPVTGSTPASPVLLYDANGNQYAPDQYSYLSAVRVPITSAQIKALATTPVALVAAQGAGTLIVPQEIVFNYLYGTATYVNGTGGAPGYELQLGSGMKLWLDTSSASPLNTLLKSTANGVFVLDPAASPTTAQWEGTSSASLNAALNFSNSLASTHDLVTGDGTVVIEVVYRLYTGLQ
jgi:hypothetical protein